MEFAKSVTSDAPNVWEPQQTVLLVQLEDSCSTLLVGIIVQESWMVTEDVSTNAHQVISDNLTKNANHVH
jgi:hypothetical protein